MIPKRVTNPITYGEVYTGVLELTDQQKRSEDMLREIEDAAKENAPQKNLLTVLAHSMDPSKPDLEYKDVYDIGHTFFMEQGKWYQIISMRMLDECKCAMHYMAKTPRSCKKRHRVIKDWVDLSKYTIEIAMQKGEQDNG